MKILIVKLGAVGDVMRTTSLLEGLREKYPEAELDWLTAKTASEVLLNNSLINRLCVWEERNELGAYDLVIGLEDDFEACQLVSSLNAKRILGAFVKDRKITYTPSAWFDMSAISKFGLETANELKKKNQKTFQRHMAKLLSISVGHYIFNLMPEEVEHGRNYVKGLGIGLGAGSGGGGKGERVIGINTGAGRRWQLKALSVEKTIDLVNRLKKELGAVSLILGGEAEKERNEVISKETGMPNGGLHSLRLFAAVINQTELLVSSDSLAMHFGIALAKKLVVFFGPTSPFEIELYSLGSKVFPKMDCLACYKKKCDIRPNCMDLLSVDDLLRAVKMTL